ncbi:hypothetical protein VTJ04DRAFT_5858 [Mycothermus thermophilus]|uniref:uncharacterized protein n=1 Tax=Humicola insolens TaxID=85995 RepID=UPI0037444CF7
MVSIPEPGEAGVVLDISRRSFATTVRQSLSHMLLPREDDCHPQPGVDLCEKPSISSVQTTWIIVGVVVGLLLTGTGSVLLFLHFRKTKRDKREDLEDRFHRADYGLDELPPSGKPPADDDLTDAGSTGGYSSSRPGRSPSRNPLQSGAEPKYGNRNGGGSSTHLNPFDDASSMRSSNGSTHAWPKREGHQPSPLGREL